MAGRPASLLSNDTGIGLRVLIVEDNIFIALDLEAQLVELGHEVVGIAATATKAIDMSRQSSPDIAIVDLQLANGSKGQDAALVLRSEMEIPSVFVSGSLHQVTDAEKEAIRPLAMLSKPLLPNELRRTLEDAVNSDLVGQNR